MRLKEASQLSLKERGHEAAKGREAQKGINMLRSIEKSFRQYDESKRERKGNNNNLLQRNRQKYHSTT